MLTEGTILVTGCAGFIGFHLAKRLLLEGHKIVGIDNINNYYDVNLKEARLSQLQKQEKFVFYKASLENETLINNIFSKHSFSTVVHLAAQAGVRYSIERPDVYVSSNIVGFQTILEACKKHKINHLLYASSSSVYGSNTKLPFAVQDNVDHPISLYAATKKANELIAHTYSHLFRLRTTGLRFFTVYGPWGRPDMALFQFTKSIMEGKEIEIYNHGNMRRDFTYIDDIVEGIYRLINRKVDLDKDPLYKIYNIGNNKPVDLLKFVSIIEKKVGRQAIKKLLPIQPGDVPETYADIEELTRDVNFKPSTPLDVGIERFVNWYKEYYSTELSRKRVGVVGLGYVGLPVAEAFSQKYPVVGFDINEDRIEELKRNVDRTGELSTEELKQSGITFTSEASSLQECDFIIVTVPTPIDRDKKPDLTPLEQASRTIGNNIKKEVIVVYESTVYPGVTEDVCIPILENSSGLASGRDFLVGYSPERINPGDEKHMFKEITKVVSGQNAEALEEIHSMYQSVINAEVYPVTSIKVAEASKVIENTQRDLNIALMNELAMIFHKLKIDTNEVLAAASTKWNFIPFKPGLVGGHCIGVDPYYMTYAAEKLGYSPDVILAGRQVNDYIAKYIAFTLFKHLVESKQQSSDQFKVTVLGVTFKENVIDIRNSKVFDMIDHLQKLGIDVQINDPLADKDGVQKEYGLELIPWDNLDKADAIVIAVPHQDYLCKDWDEWTGLLHNQKGVVFDIKSMLDKHECPDDVRYWRL